MTTPMLSPHHEPLCPRPTGLAHVPPRRPDTRGLPIVHGMVSTLPAQGSLACRAFLACQSEVLSSRSDSNSSKTTTPTASRTIKAATERRSEVTRSGTANAFRYPSPEPLSSRMPRFMESA